MFKFNLNFYDEKVYYKSNFIYNNNGLLTELLEKEDEEFLVSSLNKLEKYRGKLFLSTNVDEIEIEEYDSYVKKMQNTLSVIDLYFQEFEIAEKIYSLEEIQAKKLFDLLNQYEMIWDYDTDYLFDEEHISDEYFNYELTDEYGNKRVHNYITKFVPNFKAIYEVYQIGETVGALNKQVSALVASYITFLNDILRVKYVYKDFADNYLNVERRFLDENSLGKKFGEFLIKYGKNDCAYKRFSSGFSKISHKVLTINYESRICETYKFESLGAFLYHDLFLGIKNNHIPKKCDNCGKYFLIQAGQYTNYCASISPQDKKKTCRDIGSRIRYDDKCKTDPVWQTYNRAYKAHYARYMKKKMTVSEFEKWSTWAVDWRTKAENNEISFDEYKQEIRK